MVWNPDHILAIFAEDYLSLAHNNSGGIVVRADCARGIGYHLKILFGNLQINSHAMRMIWSPSILGEIPASSAPYRKAG
jgi:hypothetical protein